VVRKISIHNKDFVNVWQIFAYAILNPLFNSANQYFCMAEEKQDGQKTLVAFVVGLLIGGMLVWAFSGPKADAPASGNNDDSAQTAKGTDELSSETPDDKVTKDTATDKATTSATPAPELMVGEGEIVVPDQEVSLTVDIEKAIYPVSEGWIGVREYNDEKLGFILGVVRFSESQGLVPSQIILQRPTTAGRQYAVVIFTEDGDRDFSLAGDVQVDKIFDTFSAE